jgi:hypothetical protein
LSYWNGLANEFTSGIKVAKRSADLFSCRMVGGFLVLNFTLRALRFRIGGAAEHPFSSYA